MMSELDLDLGAINFGAGPQLDPEPKKSTPKKTASRPVGRPSNKSKLQDVQDEIESIMKLAFLPMLMKDVHIIEENGQQVFFSCANVYVEFDPAKGSVLTTEGKRFANAMAAIVVDSPFLLKMLTMGDDFGKWLALLLAIQPFAMTVFNNHVAVKKLEKENDRANQMG